MKSRRQWRHQRTPENENGINNNISGSTVTLKDFIVITGSMKYFRSQYSNNKVKETNIGAVKGGETIEQLQVVTTRVALLAAASSVGGITSSENNEDFEAQMSDVIL